MGKSASLQTMLDVNSAEQTKITAQAAFFETRLREQYGALDGQLGKLNSISSYMTAQIASWNKTGG